MNSSCALNQTLFSHNMFRKTAVRFNSKFIFTEYDCCQYPKSKHIELLEYRLNFVSSCNELLALDPNHNGALLSKAGHLYTQGNLVAAKKFFLKSFNNCPSAHSAASIGAMNFLQGNFQDSEQWYKTAIGIDSTYFVAHFGLAVNLLKQGGKDLEAMNHFRAAKRVKITREADHLNYLRIQSVYNDALLRIMQNDPLFADEYKNLLKEKQDVEYIVDSSVDSQALLGEESGFIDLKSDMPEGEDPEVTFLVKKGDIVLPRDETAQLEVAKLMVTMAESNEAGVIIDTLYDKKSKKVGSMYSSRIAKKKEMTMEELQENAEKIPYGTVDDAARILASGKTLTVLSGSGISRDSDLKTRKELWTVLEREQYVCHWNVYKNPEKLWNLVHDFLEDANFDPQPNVAHKALAEFEKLGLLKGIITQNVDELHQKAGNSNVLELHGTLFETKCSNCGVVSGTSLNYVKNKENTSVSTAQYPPKCPSHGNVKNGCFSPSQGYLRPNVVLFGEFVKPHLLKKATELIQESDVLLIVGTAMDVSPAAELPLLALENNCKVIEVKRKPSRISHKVSCFVSGEASTVIPHLLEKYKKRKEEQEHYARSMEYCRIR